MALTVRAPRPGGPIRTYKPTELYGPVENEKTKTFFWGCAFLAYEIHPRSRFDCWAICGRYRPHLALPLWGVGAVPGCLLVQGNGPGGLRKRYTNDPKSEKRHK